MRTALYPGSFDPVTNGHTDIIKRALALFDKVIVAIAANTSKESTFTVDERIDMLKAAIGDSDRVEFVHFEGLTSHYANERHVDSIIRGLRAVSYFEYEFQMALMNRRLNREIQTVFLMKGLRWIFTSSSIIKEAARFGGNIDDMVPDIVNQKIKQKFKRYT